MAGVDGVPGGWVVALVEQGRVRWQVVPDAPAVLAATAGCAAVAVDIPLRTPTGAQPRACDVAAARALGTGRWLDVAAALGDLPSGARMDDVLDALAAAWSAARWERGEAEVLGGGPDGFVVV